MEICNNNFSKRADAPIVRLNNESSGFPLPAFAGTSFAGMTLMVNRLVLTVFDIRGSRRIPGFIGRVVSRAIHSAVVFLRIPRSRP